MTQKNFDKLILMLIFLQMTMFNYFALAGVMNKVICALIGIRLFLFNRTYNKSNNGLVARIVILVVIILLNLSMIDADYNIFASNILMLTYCVVFILYFCNAVFSNYNSVAKLFVKAFLPINIYYVVNTLIMLRQLEDGGFMLAKATSDLAFEADLVSGLLGFGATHEVALFTCFVVLYNICYTRYYVMNNKWKFVFTIYNIFMLVTSLCISIENDNKVVFILIPFVLIWYLLFNENEKKNAKSILFGLLMVVSTAVTLIFFPMVLDGILDLVSLITDAVFVGNNVEGSGERIAMVFYSLSNLNGWCLGNGLGSNGWYKPDSFGFTHFGQADFGTFIIMGGIWFTISVIDLCRYMTSNLIGFGEKKHICTSLFLTLFLIIVSVYTQPFTSSTKTVGCLLILSVFWLDRYTFENKKSMNC